MKNFIISYGYFLLNLAVIIEFLAALIFSISLMIEQEFYVGLLAFIGLTILIVISNYLLFLIVDMHNCQKKILKNLEIILLNFNSKD